MVINSYTLGSDEKKHKKQKGKGGKKEKGIEKMSDIDRYRYE